jgi:hypothetical protein
MSRQLGNRSGNGLHRRRVGTREPLARFLIVCEGKKTEPQYFEAIPVNITVKITTLGTGRNTLSLVRFAADEREKRGYTEVKDQVWCVFDKDAFSDDDFNSAVQEAENAGMKAAYSNESFELWYVLHYEYSQSALTRSQYCRKLTMLLGRKYQKNDNRMWGVLRKKVEDAARNAEKLLASHGTDTPTAKANPSTTVHLLVKELLCHERRA